MFSGGLKKIFSSVKNSYLPAAVLAAALFWHCAFPAAGGAWEAFFHYAFYILAATTGIFLIAANRARPLFVLAAAVAAYTVVNNWKVSAGTGLTGDIRYQLLLLLLPLNFLFFMLRGDRPLRDSRSLREAYVLLLEAAVIEHAAFLFPDGVLAELAYAVGFSWLFSLSAMFVFLGMTGGIKISGMFFAGLAVAAGFAGGATPVPLCFAAACFILLAVSVQEYVYLYFRDGLTGVYSKNSYYIHAAKSFPLKYSLGVICIDDYGKLLQIFGRNKVDLLTRMVVKKIGQAGTGAEIYRYDSDEFILIFKNEDKKQSYEYLENIRRSIAGSEFVLGSGKVVKITISAGVSEKKRSDAGVEAVLARTREVLQKAYKFTQNITSRA